MPHKRDPKGVSKQETCETCGESFPATVMRVQRGKLLCPECREREKHTPLPHEERVRRQREAQKDWHRRKTENDRILRETDKSMRESEEE